MKKIVVLSCLLGFIFSCKKEEIKSPPTKVSSVEFERSSLLKSITNDIILKDVESFNLKADAFNQKINILNSISTREDLKVTEGLLDSLLIQFSRIEMFNVGPIKDNYFFTLINPYPTDTVSINELIYDTSIQLEESNFASYKLTVKGIPALEYLIYKRKDSIVSSVNAGRWLSFLKLVSSDIAKRANKVESTWIYDGYSEVFSNNIGNEFNDPIPQLINSIVAILDNIYFQELGVPSGSLGSVQPKKCRALYSELSLNSIENQIVIIEKIMKGTADNSSIGLKEYLDFLESKNVQDPLVASMILETISEIRNEIPKDKSLYQIVTSNSKEIEELRGKVKELLILFKNDVASLMSITVSISDNDGD